MCFTMKNHKPILRKGIFIEFNMQVYRTRVYGDEISKLHFQQGSHKSAF